MCGVCYSEFDFGRFGRGVKRASRLQCWGLMERVFTLSSEAYGYGIQNSMALFK